jgi:hypothetical protein
MLNTGCRLIRGPPARSPAAILDLAHDGEMSLVTIESCTRRANLPYSPEPSCTRQAASNLRRRDASSTRPRRSSPLILPALPYSIAPCATFSSCRATAVPETAPHPQRHREGQPYTSSVATATPPSSQQKVPQRVGANHHGPLLEASVPHDGVTPAGSRRFSSAWGRLLGRVGLRSSRPPSAAHLDLHHLDPARRRFLLMIDLGRRSSSVRFSLGVSS